MRKSKKLGADCRWQIRPLDSKLTFECGDDGVSMKARWIIERLDRIKKLVQENAPHISDAVRSALEEIMSMTVITDVYSDFETGFSEDDSGSDRGSLH